MSESKQTLMLMNVKDLTVLVKLFPTTGFDGTPITGSRGQKM